MESISDFWKGARERFTNPFAFAYIIAWFSYNWKITVAVFFTDKFPIQYQNVYDYISWQLQKEGVFTRPLLAAILYVLIIAVIKQLLSLLNIFLDKWGNILGLEISKGGKVPIDKYLKEKKKLDDTAKALDKAYQEEARKDVNYNNLLLTQQNTRTQLEASQTNVNNLQSKVNDLEATVTSLNKQVEKGYEFVQKNEVLEKQLLAQQWIVSKMHDVSIVNGVWRVTVNEQGEVVTDTVVMLDGIYSTIQFDTQMFTFFYDDRSKLISFQRLVPPNSQLQTHIVYALTMEGNNKLVGVESTHGIVYTKVENESINDVLNDFMKQRKENESLNSFRDAKQRGIPNLGNPNS